MATNIHIGISGSANLKQARTEVSKLQTQFKLLDAQMHRKVFDLGMPVQQAQSQLRHLGQEFAAAAAQTGQWNTVQKRVNDQTVQFTENLIKQKVAMKDLKNARKSGLAQLAYEEQLRLRSAKVSTLGRTEAGQFHAQMLIPAQADKALDTWQNKVGMAAAQMNSAATQMVNFGKNTQWAGRQLTVGFTVPLMAAGAATGYFAYNADKELTRIQKVYDTTTNENLSNIEQQQVKERELAQLRVDGLTTAKDAAKQYGASMMDTLQTQGELAATGVKGDQLQRSTNETMRLATLGEMEYQTAVQATITLQSVFGQSSEDLTKTFNYMNAVENQTSLSMQDFATAIPIAAAPIKALGGDIKDLSLLMVAMKSRGVDAAEGANAIKSAFNRLNNAGKSVKELFSAKTGQDLDALIQSTGGELIPTLQALGKSVEGLDDLSRTQVLGKIFGTYQNTRITAMLAGMTEDVNDLNSQVGRTLELSKSADSDLAAMAESEISRVTNSASGRLKRAIESIKVTMAEMGQPFLAMAATVLEATDKMLSALEALPGPVKTFLKFLTAGVAATGPIGMLVGLAYNLRGTFLKTGSALVLAATKFQLLDRNTVLATKAAEVQETAMQKQIRTTEALASSVEKLSMAFDDVTRSQTNAATKATPLQVDSLRPTVVSQTVKDQAAQKAARRQAEIDNQYQMLLAEKNIKRGEDGRYRKNGKFVSERSVKGLRGPAAKRADALYKDESGRVSYGNAEMSPEAKARLEELRAVRTERLAQAADAKRLSALELQKQEEIERVERRRLGNQRLMVAAGGLMTTGMIASLVPLGEAGSKTEAITNNIAQWSIVAGMALPAFAAIGPIMSKAGLAVSALSTRVGNATKGTGGMMTNLKGSVKAAGGLRPALAKAAKSAFSLGGMINPWVAALAAAAGGAFLLYKHLTKARDEQRKLANDASGLAEIFGFTERETGVKIDPKTGADVKSLAQQVKELNAEYPRLAENIRKVSSEEDKFLVAAQQGIKAFNAGASEEQAKQVVVAALTAAQGEAEAKRIVMKFGFNPNDIEVTMKAVQRQMDQAMADYKPRNLFTMFSDRGTSDLQAAAKTTAQLMSKEMEAGNIQAADNAGQQFMKYYTSAIRDKSPEEVAEINALIVGQFGKEWGTAKSDLRALMERDPLEVGKVGFSKPITFADITGLDPTELAGTGKDIRMNLLAAKAAIEDWDTLRDQLASGKLNKTTKSQLSWTDPADYKRYVKIIDLMKSGKTLTVEQRQTLQALASTTDTRMMTEEEILSTINAQNAAMDKASPAQANVEKSRQKLLDGLKKGLKGLDEQSSAETDALKSRQDAAMDAMQSRHDNAMDAMDKAAEAREERFDRQQERMEKRQEQEQRRFDKRWDKRIGKAEKEEDLRQKLFDAERNRIKRLAEMQNATIDFNAALNTGNLDEAARVVNTQNATVETNSLDDLDSKLASKAESKQERMNDQRENAQYRLKLRQDTESKALAATRKSYAKQVAAARDAAQKTYEAQRKGAERAHEAERKNLEATQALRKRNLERAIKAVTEYDAKTDGPWGKFLNKLQRKFGNFSGAAKTAFNKAMTEAFRKTNEKADAFGSSNKWGLRSADAMEHWLNKAGSSVGLSAKELKKFSRKHWATGYQGGKTRHSGGAIDSRKGYPKGASKFPSEEIVLAKKSEYMMQTSAHRKYGTRVMDAVNKGEAQISVRHSGGAINLPAALDDAQQVRMEGVAQKIATDITLAAKRAADRARKAAKGNVGGGGFKPPTGKWNSPWRGHYSTRNGHDYGLVNAPLFAPTSGTVQAKAIPGYESRVSHGGHGFRSYGQHIKFNGGGQSMMFAHLSKLPVAAGKSMKVKAGQYMGTTGETGNAHGAHVHVELPFGSGNTGNFGAFFNRAGVSLRKGGTIKYDNTAANLHKGETVLTDNLTKKFKEGVEGFANGGDTNYNVNVTVAGNATSETADQIADKVIKKIRREQSRKGSGR